LIAGFIASPAVASTEIVACKLVDNIDPSPSRYQFEITNTCLSPACLSSKITPVTLPVGAKIVVKSLAKGKKKTVSTDTFVLDKALAPKASTRFDRKPQGASCTATASW
jgi:hypothetical protein